MLVLLAWRWQRCCHYTDYEDETEVVDVDKNIHTIRTMTYDDNNIEADDAD